MMQDEGAPGQKRRLNTGLEAVKLLSSEWSGVRTHARRPVIGMSEDDPKTGAITTRPSIRRNEDKTAMCLVHIHVWCKW